MFFSMSRKFDAILLDRETILDRIGNKGLVKVVAKASPGVLRSPVSIPLGLKIYHEILGSAMDLTGVETLHKEEYSEHAQSALYRFFRPSSKEVINALRDYGIE